MGYKSWAGQPYGGTRVDFLSGVINISYHPTPMNFIGTNGIISDRLGNLLFSSNGIYVANALGDTMINGEGLNPSYYTSAYDSFGLPIDQGNLIIPFIGDSNKYYLFHQTSDDHIYTYCSLYLYYSVIDMLQDSGKGAVVQKNIILLNDSLVAGKLSACKHANGRDWWLLVHQYNTNRLFKFLITPGGVQQEGTQDVGSIRGALRGQSVFSPDGKYYAYYEPRTNDLDIFDFDRCSGILNLLAHTDIYDTANVGGVAFSPSSKVLYVSSLDSVYQFDLLAANIIASQTTVAVWDSFYSPHYPLASNFYLSQLAPDGKIYIACGNSTIDMHVIEFPDSLGLACYVCQHCIHLPTYNAFTVPNYPNYFLGAEGGTICDSLPTNLSDPHFKSVLNIYPNPIYENKTDITFTYNTIRNPGVISVYDVNGKEISNYYVPPWSSIHHVRLPELSNGIYLAKLTSDGFEVTLMFVVE